MSRSGQSIGMARTAQIVRCLLVLGVLSTTTCVAITDICADIMFIVDESEVLLAGPFAPGWQQLKDFIIITAAHYRIGQENTRFSVVGFGTTAKVQIEFTQSTDIDTLIEAVNHMELVSLDPEQGARNTTDGFVKAYNHFAESIRDPQAPRYAIFIPLYACDQCPFGNETDLFSATLMLKSLDVQLYEVPIIGFQWDKYFQAEIFTIYDEYGHDQAHVYEVADYVRLPSSPLVQDLMNDAEAHSSCPHDLV